MPKLKLINVAHATGGQIVHGAADVLLSGVSTDTRSLRAGNLFVPITGERFDGHDFFADAIARGAGGLLVEKRKLALLPNDSTPAIVVDDALEALQKLAAWHRSSFSGPVVAITGSNGKTTTKDMIRSVLGHKWPVLATEGNLNTEIGLSLTLLQREPNHEAIVVEMGMRGLGQIHALVDIARPTVGVVTNIGPVHLELLGSLDAVTEAKGELVQGLPPSGVAVLNADDPRVLGLSKRTRAQTIMYGLTDEADVRATDLVSRGLDGISFRLIYRDQSASVQLPIPGRHNVFNALAAAATAVVCGLSPDDIAQGLNKLQLSDMRMQIVRLDSDIILLNDAYNASPMSMQAGLKALFDLPAKRYIAILGDMLELGPIADEEHEKIGVIAAQLGVDLLVVVGPLSRSTARGARHEGLSADCVFEVDSADEAKTIVANRMKPGDAVLVKASRGMQLETIVTALQSETTQLGGHD